MKYYISDYHFQDKRVFDLCKRPFKNIDEFQDEAIRLWNETINENDEVYVLGDIFDENHKEALNIFKKLKGIKYLVLGNHDMNMMDYIKKANIFKEVELLMVIKDETRNICLSHYPMMDWYGYDYGYYHIYGHIHNKNKPQIKDFYKDKLAFNASCDVIGFKPRTLDELIKFKEANVDEPYIN